MPISYQTDYSLLVMQADALTQDEPHYLPNLANISSLLWDAMEDLNWCGFYLAADKTLILGPFQGKTACIRIPFGKGVCGTAAATDTTQLVPDVHQFPGHIACDSASNSEIVIPVHGADGSIVAVLDIDSPKLERFSEIDAQGLEQIVKVLEKNCTFCFTDIIK